MRQVKAVHGASMKLFCFRLGDLGKQRPLKDHAAIGNWALLHRLRSALAELSQGREIFEPSPQSGQV